MKYKYCFECKKYKPISEFYNKRNNIWECKSCSDKIWTNKIKKTKTKSKIIKPIKKVRTQTIYKETTYFLKNKGYTIKNYKSTFQIVRAIEDYSKINLNIQKRTNGYYKKIIKKFYSDNPRIKTFFKNKPKIFKKKFIKKSNHTFHKSYKQKTKEFYASKEWRELRYVILKEQKGRCQLCGRGRKDGIVLHCDHITPLSKDWEKRLDKDNIQVLCADCNLGKSNYDSIDWRNN